MTKKSSDAHAINNGLKINMNNLGLRLDAFMKQQEEVRKKNLYLVLRDKMAHGHVQGRLVIS